MSYDCLSFINVDQFGKIAAVVIVVVAAAVSDEEHRPLVMSGQDGGSNINIGAGSYM